MASQIHKLLGVDAAFTSPALEGLLRKTQSYAKADAAVLIEGESGSGKEIFARALHQFSNRAAKPWVDVSCATLPESLVESELFGYEKGAFSGANAPKAGLFELAHGGTLFLDEIGELDLRLQVKLLRVLDNGTYYRLGGAKQTSVDVRIVVATNRDLRNEVGASRFREDLYYRLAQLRITVPPLRERVEDILPIAKLVLRKYKAGARFTPEVEYLLERYSWPGNVRELRNVVTSAVTVAKGQEIRAEDLPEELSGAPRAGAPGFGEMLNLDDALQGAGPSVKHRGVLESLEKQVILRVLEKTGGHQERAAQILGVSARTVNRKLKAYRN